MNYIRYAPGYSREGDHRPYWSMHDGEPALVIPVDHSTRMVVSERTVEILRKYLQEAETILNASSNFRGTLAGGPVVVPEVSS